MVHTTPYALEHSDQYADNRRLARDYEAHPHRSEAMIYLAMIDLKSRRLTREATLNWRGTWLARTGRSEKASALAKAAEGP